MRRRKGGEEKKSNGCTLVVFSGWLLWREISGRKKLLDAKGPFGDNVLKNPARCMYVCVCLCVCVYVWLYVFCNCRKKPDCPLEGKCLQSNVIYQATVTTATTTETYVGLATNFKERYRNHQSSFRRSNRRNETELSKCNWTLQDSKKPFQIKWKVLKKCKPNSNISKKCVIFVFMKSSSSVVKNSFVA